MQLLELVNEVFVFLTSDLWLSLVDLGPRPFLVFKEVSNSPQILEGILR
jgi:hypothetical protein